ncbi:MAG: DUF1800 domain-containing protein [Chitinophagaceae bacterium]
MDRREFLTSKRRPVYKQPYTYKVSIPSDSSLAAYTGSWGKPELAHLLKRTMFGAATVDLDYFKSRSLPDVVSELLNPSAPLPPPPIKEYDSTGALVPDTNVAAGTTWVNDPATDGAITSRRKASLKKWWTGLIINQDRSIREKMTIFWHNHFSTEMDVLGDSQFLYKHHNLLRTNCLGNFKSLVKAVTIDPSMLVYLSGNNSTLTAPNENYARELQELFAIGKENNPNYSEDDVKAAARVLTGWRTTAATVSSYYDNTRHDKANKQFSSFYNNTIITGRNSTTAGDQEIDDLLTMIFNKKAEVSKFIVKKIYRWFCYYAIDAKTEANVILPLANIFVTSNWDIKPVLSALFNSEHFFDARNRGCLIKSPIDMVTGMCREFNFAFPNVTTAYIDAYGMYEYVRNYTSTMGQSIGDPPNVAGWPSYYQEPQFHELWLNTDTLPKRNKFTDVFIGSGYTNAAKTFTIKIDPLAFAKNTSNPGNPNQLIDDSLAILFTVPLSDASKASIKKQILLSGQETDQYWTDAWIAYLGNQVITGTPYKTVLSRLQTFYKYLMNLAEYQLS